MKWYVMTSLLGIQNATIYFFPFLRLRSIINLRNYFWVHLIYTYMYNRVHEIFGHVRRTVFPGDFAWWVEISSFIFLPCREVVRATLAFLVSGPHDFIAISRDYEIASTLTTKRTPSFAARWPNSSQKLLLCSKNQQNFPDLKNIASSPRYGDFSERGPQIHRAA